MKLAPAGNCFYDAVDGKDELVVDFYLQLQNEAFLIRQEIRELVSLFSNELELKCLSIEQGFLPLHEPWDYEHSESNKSSARLQAPEVSGIEIETRLL